MNTVVGCILGALVGYALARFVPGWMFYAVLGAVAVALVLLHMAGPDKGPRKP